MLHDFVAKVRLAYRSSGETLRLPQKPHIHRPDYVRSSSLGLCALAHAYQKMKRPYDLPHLDPDNNIQLADTMDGGTYKAMMYQEPFVWYATKNKGITADAEREYVDDRLKLTGRADLYVETDFDVPWLIEMKYSTGTAKDTPADPRLTYCLQILSYAMMAGYEAAEVKPRLFIVTIGKKSYATWELKPEGDGFVIYDNRNDLPYQEPAYFRKFNTPEILNFDRVRKEVETLHYWMELVQKSGGGAAINPPITDPLNGENSWLCVSTTKPTKTKPGKIVPACGWCKTCHGIVDEEEVEGDENGFLRRSAAKYF